MDKREISELIGERLQVLRRSKGFSLDALANLTGVSKPMLGQIERGVSNPTVATLWKIASGLGVPFTAFIANEPQVTVLRKEEQTVLYDDEGRYQVYNTWNTQNGHVEVFRISLLPGCHRYSEPHAAGVMECVTVFIGSVQIALANTVHTLRHGDVLSFSGDVPHEYINPTDSAAEVQLLILYP